MRDYILEQQIELVESWLAGDETDWQQHADDCKAILRQIEQRALREGYPDVVAATQIRGNGIKHTRQVLATCLAALESPAPPTSNGDGLLNLEAAAKILNCSTSTLRRLVKAKQIRFLQKGQGPIHFQREWLDDYISGNAKAPEGPDRRPAQKRSKPIAFDIDPNQFGFDPSLFKS